MTTPGDKSESRNYNLRNASVNPTANSMHFIASTRCHCISANRNGNLEHQFRYRAGVLPLQNDVKNVCSTPFNSDGIDANKKSTCQFIIRKFLLIIHEEHLDQYSHQSD